MARVEPLRALHYDPAVAGPHAEPRGTARTTSSTPSSAPSSPRARRTTSSRSTCPRTPTAATATRTPPRCSSSGAPRARSSQDDEPALWAIVQDYTGPDGRTLTRNGFFARVRVEDYGPGTIRPHERTHPGPKEDRLRLTRATRANLSPIFSLYSDPELAAWRALEPATQADEPFAEVTEADGTHNRLWRIADPDAIATVQAAIADAELLIADGHHRYETARVYADEIGGEGAHRYVLMCLVALQDEGLTVFPTHRLVSGLKGDNEKIEALTATLKRRASTSRRSRPTTSCRPARATARSRWATWTATSSARFA